MLRSRANALVSFPRVTEINVGRKTVGIDGRTALWAQAKSELASWVQHLAASWDAQARTGVIPKTRGKQRDSGFR